MKNSTSILVDNLGHVIVFYTKVKETDKSVWLQRIGSSVKKSDSNNGHEWEVVPDVTNVQGEVFRKMKTPSGIIKMEDYSSLKEYDEKTQYMESDF